MRSKEDSSDEMGGVRGFVGRVLGHQAAQGCYGTYGTM